MRQGADLNGIEANTLEFSGRVGVRRFSSVGHLPLTDTGSFAAVKFDGANPAWEVASNIVRSRIVEVATDVLRHDGFRRMKLEEIARKVGVSIDQLNQYFQDKAALGAAIMARYLERFSEQLALVEARFDHACQRLEAYVGLFVASYRVDHNLCLCGIMGREAERLPDEMKAQLARFFSLNRDWLARILAAGRAAGVVDFIDSPVARALMFMSSLEGAMVVARGMQHDGLIAEVVQTALTEMRLR